MISLESMSVVSEATLAVASDTNQETVIWVMKAPGFENKEECVVLKKESGSAASI